MEKVYCYGQYILYYIYTYYRFLRYIYIFLCQRLSISSHIKNTGNDNAELKPLLYYLESKLFCFAIHTVPGLLITSKSSVCPRQFCPLPVLEGCWRKRCLVMAQKYHPGQFVEKTSCQVLPRVTVSTSCWECNKQIHQLCQTGMGICFFCPGYGNCDSYAKEIPEFWQTHLPFTGTLLSKI